MGYAFDNLWKAVLYERFRTANVIQLLLVFGSNWYQYKTYVAIPEKYRSFGEEDPLGGRVKNILDISVGWLNMPKWADEFGDKFPTTLKYIRQQSSLVLVGSHTCVC